MKPSYKKTDAGYVYIIKCANFYKIGYTNSVMRRMKQLDTRPFPLELIYTRYFSHAYSIEQELHKEYEDFRVDGEWYDFNYFDDNNPYAGNMSLIDYIVFTLGSIKKDVTSLWVED